jgi:hypothetical protein
MRKNEGIARAKEHTLEAKERVRMYQLLPTDEQRRARIARISAHYNRELQRLKRGTGSWRQLALLFLVGIAIIVGAASFNNELVLLIGLLLAIVPFFGSSRNRVGDFVEWNADKPVHCIEILDYGRGADLACPVDGRNS